LLLHGEPAIAQVARPYLVFDPVFVDGRSVVLWTARQRFPAFS
jgi:hypothetical protein